VNFILSDIGSIHNSFYFDTKTFIHYFFWEDYSGRCGYDSVTISEIVHNNEHIAAFERIFSGYARPHYNSRIEYNSYKKYNWKRFDRGQTVIIPVYLDINKSIQCFCVKFKKEFSYVVPEIIVEQALKNEFAKRLDTKLIPKISYLTGIAYQLNNNE
jgi:hypothetical protein